VIFPLVLLRLKTNVTHRQDETTGAPIQLAWRQILQVGTFERSICIVIKLCDFTEATIASPWMSSIRFEFYLR
jgi:hypothetical protein